MDKDSIANVVSFGGMTAVMLDFQTVLTICLLVTGIVLNLVRIRSSRKRSGGSKGTGGSED